MDVAVGTNLHITIQADKPTTLLTLDFGDGSGFQDVNGYSSNSSHTYTLEGEYYITGKQTNVCGPCVQL